MSAHAPNLAPDLPDRLLTAEQAARLLSVHISTIRRWIVQGKRPDPDSAELIRQVRGERARELTQA